MWRQLFGVEIIELFYYTWFVAVQTCECNLSFCARKGVQHGQRRLGSVSHVAQVENVVCRACALVPIAPRWHRRLRSLLFSHVVYLRRRVCTGGAQVLWKCK